MRVICESPGRQEESPIIRATRNWQIDSKKKPLGPNGRNNGSQAQQINKWVLKRQVGSKKPEKKEMASHGQCMRKKSEKEPP